MTVMGSSRPVLTERQYIVPISPIRQMTAVGFRGSEDWPDGCVVPSQWHLLAPFGTQIFPIFTGKRFSGGLPGRLSSVGRSLNAWSEARSQKLEEKLQQKETEIAELKQRLEKLERLINRCAGVGTGLTDGLRVLGCGMPADGLGGRCQRVAKLEFDPLMTLSRPSSWPVRHSRMVAFVHSAINRCDASGRKAIEDGGATKGAKYLPEGTVDQVAIGAPRLRSQTSTNPLD